jgi:tetratricopeptide (TPR) repeat protein
MDAGNFLSIHLVLEHSMVAKQTIPMHGKESAKTERFLQRLQHQDWFAGLLLILGIFIAYQQVWHAGFIWDDDHHLTANPCIVGPLGFKDIWTTSAAVYYPLVLSSFWVQHFFWGLNPLPYHLVNVALHAACAILLWRVLQALQVRGAWLGAALWALHPVQAESVAWITEQKNTQSCLFYLLAIYFFVKWRAPNEIENRNGGNWKYALALVCALLAILSKPSTVMLPVALGLCWWWLEGRWRWRNVTWLIPFFLISIAASGWTIWEQQFHSGALGQEWAESRLDRMVIAGKDVWFYIGKLCWPHPLIFIYPKWEINSSRLLSYLPGLAAAIGLLALWLNRNTALRPVFFAFTYFVISLFPVLGFFTVYFFRYSFVADHFLYLASMGPLALAAAGIVTLWDFLKRKRLWLEMAVCVALLGLGTLTWQQVRIYRNIETLWTDTLEKNPTSWMSDNNLGLVLLQKGHVEEAIRYYKKAIQVNPDSYNAEYNLGNALLQRGQVEEAITHYKRAIEINPDYVDAHDNLGNALFQTGRAEEAIIHYKKAIELNPNSSKAEYNLGDAFFQMGQMEEAIAHYKRAIQINPNSSETEYNLGNALLRTSDLKEAITHYKKAIEINPNYADAHNNLGNILLQTGQMEEAMFHFKKALEIEPRFAKADNNMGIALLRMHRLDEARDYFGKAIKINPNYGEAHYNLGGIFRLQGNLDEAVQEYRRALELSPNSAQAHYQLGLTLQKQNKLTDAIAEYQEALRLNPQLEPAKQQLRILGESSPQ